MANLSQKRREKMLEFLEKLKEQHTDDDSLIAIGQIEKELTSKKYGLVWEEHEEEVDVKMQTHIPVFSEDKSREIAENPDSENYNFLLEGDNLHSLKLLEKTHRGKIDIIYIDPPYNTGNTDGDCFIYDDRKIGKEDSYKHSLWISFMYQRLIIASKLLSKKGVLFINIDDNEFSQLKLLCDSIFGEQNFVTTIHWKRSESQNNNAKQISVVGEYILCYAINKSNRTFNKINLKVTALKEYRYIDEITGKKFRRGTIVDNTRGKNILEITSPNGIKKTIKSIRSKEFFEEKEKNGEIYWTNTGTPYLKIFLEKSEGQIASNWFDNVGVNEDATDELKALGVSFPFSKPKELIIQLLKIVSEDKSIILDFFAGSGTTGQAILELNREDGGNRHFILCTNNENGICENVTYQRLKTVITGKRADGSTYSDGISANLKYYKTDFVAKDSENLSDELLAHIREMIQLEHGVKVDGRQYVMIMDDEEMDIFERNFSEYTDLKAVFVNQDVLLSAEQEKLLRKIQSFVIPDYYFDFELREAGEIW